MKKLYYTCPVSAAYMMKNFGVKFEDELEIDDPFSSAAFYGGEWAPFYVHSDSISIFEPQEGDYIETDNPDGKTPEKVHKVKKSSQEYAFGVEDREWYWLWYGEQLPKIIQRNNKPFIMPQEEE